MGLIEAAESLFIWCKHWKSEHLYASKSIISTVKRHGVIASETFTLAYCMKHFIVDAAHACNCNSMLTLISFLDCGAYYYNKNKE